MVKLVTHDPDLRERLGGGTETTYSNASVSSTVSFSWLSPLIAVGNKRTLDPLEDVPQLAPRDSILGALPGFRKKLKPDVGAMQAMEQLRIGC